MPFGFFSTASAFSRMHGFSSGGGAVVCFSWRCFSKYALVRMSKRFLIKKGISFIVLQFLVTKTLKIGNASEMEVQHVQARG